MEYKDILRAPTRRIIKALEVHAAFVGFEDQRGASIFLSSSYINIYERDRYIAFSSAAFSEFLQFVQICSPPIAAVEMHFCSTLSIDMLIIGGNTEIRLHVLIVCSKHGKT